MRCNYLFCVVLSLLLAHYAFGAATTLHAAAQLSGRYFGTCMTAGQVNDGSYNSIVKTEFGAVTCENEMKQDATEPNQGQFSFSSGDTVLNWCNSNGKWMRGHTLAWHSQQPGWMSGMSGSSLRNAMNNHITNVLKHYVGKIKVWDVVNEAYGDESGQRRQSNLQGTGNDWIEVAFKTARGVDTQSVFCYNDFNIENMDNDKTKSVLAMVKDFKDRNVPIDCVGMQAHFNNNKYSQVTDRFQATIQAFADIGVIVQLTELDIQGASPENYGKVVKACMAVDKCQGISVWGIRDANSWRSEQTPLLWSGSTKKPAYQTVLDTLNAATIQFTNGTTQPPNPCASSPCKNGGSCNNGACTCAAGYSGPTCTTDKCASVKCLNNGSCNNGVCTCVGGYTGDTCATAPVTDKCANVKCANGGSCGADTGKCTCVNGYSGANCTTAPDTPVATCTPACSTTGGKCVNGACSCNAGYSGPTCSTRANTTNPCASIECQNDGTCRNGKCYCAEGYTGDLCETPDEGPTQEPVTCSPACQNGGNCLNGACKCINGYSGASCSQKPVTDPCANVGCNGGTCQKLSSTDYVCKCGEGMQQTASGTSCEAVKVQNGNTADDGSTNTILIVIAAAIGVAAVAFIIYKLCNNPPARLTQFIKRASQWGGAGTAPPPPGSGYATNTYPPAPPAQYRPY